MKLLTLESHFIKSESFDQASLHAAILVGFLVQCLMIDCINAEHFKNGGTSLCSPISNRLAPKKIKTKKENTQKSIKNLLCIPRNFKVHMYITKTVIFRKQIELTVTIGQLPAGLVKPEPY